MSTTRNESFKKMKKSGGLAALDGQVLAAIEKKTTTRQEISEENDIPINSVSGAVTRLLRLGLICEIGSRKNPETGKRNAILAVFKIEEVA